MQKITSHTEAELIQKLRKGNTYAFEKIFSMYSKRLYQFSFSYLKSEKDSEEIVQDVFLKLWEKRKELKTETSFQSYLFTITLNLIKKQFRKQSRAEEYRSKFMSQLQIENEDLETLITYKDVLTKLDQLIDQLPEKRKQIFIQRKHYEKPVKQIAQEMGISIKTVETQLTRAIRFLRSELHKENFENLFFFSILIISDFFRNSL